MIPLCVLVILAWTELASRQSDGSGAHLTRLALFTLGGELAVTGQWLLVISGQILLAARIVGDP